MKLRLVPALALVALLLPTQPGVALDGDPATTERIDQSDATAAAIDVSMLRFGVVPADYAIVSRDDVFADSLAGSALTANGPLLFTNSAALTTATRDELRRVLVAGATVYLLGGIAAISQSVEDEIASNGYPVVRLQGPTRVETAIAVADEVRSLYPPLPDYRSVLLARGYSPDDNPTAAWADSVTGGGIAAALTTPILITPTDALHPAVDAWLDFDQPNVTTLLGGTAALSDAVFNAAPNPERVAGPAREDTAVAIAAQLWLDPDDGAREYIVFNGYAEDGWAFGLAAASLTVSLRAPILITHPDVVPVVTLARVDSCGAAPEVDLTIMGSDAIVSDARVSVMDAVDPHDCVAGVDSDGDGRADGEDNCPDDSNAGQEDHDGDGVGDMCDGILEQHDLLLEGDQEVSPGDPDGAVEAQVRINSVDDWFCVVWYEVHELDPAEAAHLHQGAAGTNGPPVITFSVMPSATGVTSECLEIDAALAADIVANGDQYYLNVHNATYPAGAVRDQLPPT